MINDKNWNSFFIITTNNKREFITGYLCVESDNRIITGHSVIRKPWNHREEIQVFEYLNAFGYPKTFKNPKSFGYPEFPRTRPKKIEITRPEKMFYPHAPIVLVHSKFKLLHDLIFCTVYYFIKIFSPFQRHAELRWSVIGPFILW